MIEVKLFYQEKILVGIESKGHSDYSEKGSDIICSAVSVLMQSLMYGLHDVAKIDSLVCHIDDNVPLISVSWPKKFHSKISILTLTISEALTQIAKDNPYYVKVKTEELRQ